MCAVRVCVLCVREKESQRAGCVCAKERGGRERAREREREREREGEGGRERERGKCWCGDVHALVIRGTWPLYLWCAVVLEASVWIGAAEGVSTARIAWYAMTVELPQTNVIGAAATHRWPTFFMKFLCANIWAC